MEQNTQKQVITQIGILTNDIYASKAAWEKFLGIDPQPVSESYGYEVTGAVYRGRPLEGRIWQVNYQFANTELELIQPKDDTPSYWKECLDKNGPGIHHIAFNVKDMDASIAECEAAGMTLAQRGNWPGGKDFSSGSYAYVDAMDTMHVVLELLKKDGEVTP